MLQLDDCEKKLGQTPPHNAKTQTQIDLSSTRRADEETSQLQEVTSWQTSILIVLSAHFVVMNTSGFTNSFGALQSHFIQEFDEPASTVSWIGSMQIFFYFFLGIFSGRLTDIGYFRATFLAGSLAMVVGIFASSFGSELWVMFLTLGVGVGLGNGLMSCPMLTVVSQYFSERRGLAIGVAMCGSCTGGLVYSGTMRQLIPQLGFAWTMRVIALIQFITLAFANICLRPRTQGSKSPDWVDWSAFRDSRFNNYALAIFMSLLGLYISIFYVVDFSRSCISPPFSYQDSLNLLLVFNAANLVGRLGSGILADKVGALVIFVPVMASMTVVLFAWIAVKTSLAMYFWTVFCGILSGGVQSLFPAGLSYLTAGAKKSGTRMGMVFGLGSVASLIGAPIGGALIGVMNGRYLGAQIFAGVTMAVAAIFVEAARRADVARAVLESSNDSFSTMRSQSYTNLDHVPYRPEDTETVNPSDLWNPTPINNSFDPQISNTTPAPAEVDQSHATDTYHSNAASESFNDVPADKKPTTQIPQRQGKRLSLISVRILNKWLSTHMHHPYPTVAEVESLTRQTGLSKQQVLNWFANARRRKKFERPDTLDYSSGSSEASPRDIPLPRPPTPTIRQTPFERWRSSPPEDEPSGLDAIARAVTGVSHPQQGGSWVKHSDAPSVAGSWATSAETSESSRSSHASSHGYKSDGSIRSIRKVNKKRRRARPHGRGYGTMQLSQECHRFQCTFCTESFKLKHTWTRHEKTQHLSLEQWECTPAGATFLNERSETVCVHCGAVSPEDTHFETHNHDLCDKREKIDRIFYRKDHLRQHLRLVHGSEFRKWPMEDWKVKHEDVRSRCGFCDINMTTWSERARHLAEHFKEGMTMADWKGNWGFDAVTLDMVENSMPPYLIDYERNSPLPFTTSQGAPYSSTSAFELLQLELDYFYSNYVDTNHIIPSDETLHTEACSIIFGAEMSSSTPQAASSWLRDLIMGTEHITAKARMTPLKSAARSRFTELRIHSKKDIFENCNLENSLRQYVDMLKLLNLEIGDDELQREACSIVSHMIDASPMFTNLLIALINGSTQWLVPFRSRTGLPIVETEINLQLDGRETEIRDATSLDLDILQQILAEDTGHNTLGHTALTLNLASSNQKVASLNDGNMYRGLTRDLTRYVARTISPLNPTSHVPTDEELQYQARWIMYDSHDVWNQTPADNMAWLEEFKKESGLFG
ncbi:Riboflavin transporter MCH5 [Fusarium culmorum]|uniref:Riboflavin transporter MCH5 n=1 Tax=Fusarium culmorum TaxID=5516 RepID=A0A2T4GRW9_FUSCU|nr:Riboflavin transporter MCH5 [Fusarium culmorum]